MKSTQLCFYQTFCIVQALQNVLLINKKTLFNYICNCKEQSLFKELLNNINVDELEEFISDLVKSKYLIKQKDYKNILQINERVLKLDLKQNYYLKEMMKFVFEYNKYEMMQINKTTAKIYNQEENDIKALVKSFW